MTDPLHTEPRVEVMPEDYDRSHDAWVRLAQEYGVGNLVPPWFDQAFARHRAAAEAASRAEVERERSAVVSYLNHAADEAGGLAEKAQTEATAAMFRAIHNAFVGLGKFIADGDHLRARAASEAPDA